MGNGFFIVHIKIVFSLSYKDFENISNINNKWISPDEKKIVYKILLQEVIKSYKNQLNQSIIDYKCISIPDQGVLTIRFKIPYSNNYLTNITSMCEKIISDLSESWNLIDNPIHEFKMKSITA